VSIGLVATKLGFLITYPNFSAFAPAILFAFGEFTSIPEPEKLT
jgi:hypothetical protein